MEPFSLPHILMILATVLVLFLVLFGGRRIPELMNGLGEGIRSFREGLPGEERPGEEKPAGLRK